MKYDAALNTSIMVYDKVKAMPDLADKYVEALNYVKTCAMSCKKYDIAYPYLVEYEEIMLNKSGRNSQEYADALNQRAVATMGTKPDEAKNVLMKHIRFCLNTTGKTLRRLSLFFTIKAVLCNCRRTIMHHTSC